MAPKAQKKPVADQKNKKLRKKSVEAYGINVLKTLKLINPDIGITRDTIENINFFVNHILDKLMKEASRLATIARKRTITVTHVHAALRLVFPGKLADGAISEGNKAVKKFNENTMCYD
ncbi:histone H2B.1-like [Bidens hawaiensis]|uniref:histone H2B.1-like n=1 Tax=Bidens hawaiensis TaxID=980011 RepID=UPI00404B6ABE